MFLVKCGKKFYELTNTTSITLCPDCNEVHQVDIVGLLSDVTTTWRIRSFTAMNVPAAAHDAREA